MSSPQFWLDSCKYRHCNCIELKSVAFVFRLGESVKAKLVWSWKGQVEIWKHSTALNVTSNYKEQGGTLQPWQVLNQ